MFTKDELDKIKHLCDSVKVKDESPAQHTANYLWTWRRDNVSELRNELIEASRSGKDGKAIVDKFYNELKKEVDSILKEGYKNWLDFVSILVKEAKEKK